MKNNKGITLIALIITIIVMLILAAVAIAMATGDDGVIGKAGEAVKTQTANEIAEKMQLEIAAERIGSDGKINPINSEMIRNAADKLGISLSECYENAFVVDDVEYEINQSGKVKPIIDDDDDSSSSSSDSDSYSSDSYSSDSYSSSSDVTPIPPPPAVGGNYTLSFLDLDEYVQSKLVEQNESVSYVLVFENPSGNLGFVEMYWSSYDGYWHMIEDGNGRCYYYDTYENTWYTYTSSSKDETPLTSAPTLAIDEILNETDANNAINNKQIDLDNFERTHIIIGESDLPIIANLTQN